MSSFRFGIITPSYAPDFERCRLLCQSIDQFVAPRINHYIIVDRADLALFSSLRQPHTQIITKEEILPWWIKRVPWGKNSWVSLKSLPLRGWLLQQIIKISAAQYIDEEVAVFVDSDVSFVRPFNFQSFVRNDQVRLYDEPDGNFDWMHTHVKWHQNASLLLDLPPTPFPAPDYIDHVITWRRDNVVKMCEHVEQVSGRGWIETLSRVWHLSEYILYGTFVDRVLGEQAGHDRISQKLCHSYWGETPMSDDQLQGFMQEIAPEHVAVMMSAKSKMSVNQYEAALQTILQP